MITFTREDGEANIVVKSSDNFETATIVIEDQEHAAKMVESADGVKVATEDGKISVHFKNDYGVLEMDGTEVNLTVVKRSEEHTSELQSRQYLVCRLLLEKKKYRDT